jgi:PhnB protein
MANDPTTTTIVPFLSVRNGAKAVDFYKVAFGAEEIFRHDGEDGTVVCNLSVNGAPFWVADEAPDFENFSPETLKGGTVRIVLTTDDPDAAFQRAVDGGATVVLNMKEAYGWRIGRVRDPFGHHWEIGKPLPRA